jgi:exosortase H (IPTLxxWG-CTERM-specific)
MRPLQRMEVKSTTSESMSQVSTSFWSRWRRWFAGKAPVVRFVVTFAVLIGAFYAFLLMPFLDRMLYRYLSLNAWLANGILNVLGQETTVAGTAIRSSGFAVNIQRGCDAIEPSWLFCAAVLAFPVSWKTKPIALLAGVPVILMLNLVRIVSLYFIGIHAPALFNLFHLEIWPVVLILVALLLWMGWIHWVRRRVSHA